MQMVGWIVVMHTLALGDIHHQISAKSLDENGGIELKFFTIPCLAITVGHLAGAWVRCEGKPVKVT